MLGITPIDLKAPTLRQQQTHFSLSSSFSTRPFSEKDKEKNSEAMKREYRLFVTFLCLLSLLVSSTSSRFLVQKQGQNEVKVNEITRPVSDRNTNVEVNKLTMTSGEYCSEKDEECRHGRMLADAHLDYVYTERNNP